MAKGETPAGRFTSWAKKEEIADQIQPIAKKEAKDKQYDYDPNEWKNAPAPVRANLTKKWLDKVRKAHQIDSKKIYGSLGLSGKEKDEDLVDRIKQFQTERGLKADGIMGPKTLEALDKASGDTGKFDKPVKKIKGGVETEETYQVQKSTVSEQEKPKETDTNTYLDQIDQELIQEEKREKRKISKNLNDTQDELQSIQSTISRLDTEKKPLTERLKKEEENKNVSLEAVKIAQTKEEVLKRQVAEAEGTIMDTDKKVTEAENALNAFVDIAPPNPLDDSTADIPHPAVPTVNREGLTKSLTGAKEARTQAIIEKNLKAEALSAAKIEIAKLQNESKEATKKFNEITGKIGEIGKKIAEETKKIPQVEAKIKELTTQERDKEKTIETNKIIREIDRDVLDSLTKEGTVQDEKGKSDI